MGGIKDAFTFLGSAIERGIGVASEHTKKVAHNAYDVTIGQSKRENQSKVGNDNVYELYKEAMRKRSRGEVHGNPEMERLNQILGQQGMTLSQFEKGFASKYKKIG